MRGGGEAVPLGLLAAVVMFVIAARANRRPALTLGLTVMTSVVGFLAVSAPDPIEQLTIARATDVSAGAMGGRAVWVCPRPIADRLEELDHSVGLWPRFYDEARPVLHPTCSLGPIGLPRRQNRVGAHPLGEQVAVARGA